MQLENLPSPSRAGRRRSTGLALAGLLLVGFALRLGFAAVDLHGGRFYDERFALENVRSILEHGSLEPANGFHPSLSYLPATAALAPAHLLARAGVESAAVLAPDIITPLGYFLGRLAHVLLGTLVLGLTFEAGRRLFSPAVGLLATLLLVAAPWPLRQSALINEDMPLVAFTLVAVLAALRVARQPSLGRYLLAGGALGLALSSKFNAGPAAMPLLIATIGQSVRARRTATGSWWRPWLGLALAAAAAGAVLLALNPYLVLDPAIYLRDMGRTLRDYERKGSALGDSRLGVVLHLFSTLCSMQYFGPVLGGICLLGAAWLAVDLVRLHGEPDAGQQLQRAMVLGFLVAYPATYAVATSNVSPHNWLVLAPLTAVAGARALADLGRWARGRLPPRSRAPALAAALVALAALALPPGVSFAYRGAVKPTHELARRHLLEMLPDPWGRLIYAERPADEKSAHWRVVKRRKRTATLVVVDRLDTVQRPWLERADALAFPAARLEGPEGELYRSLMAPPEAEAALLAPRFGRWRGEPLMVVFRRFEPVTAPQPVRFAPGPHDRVLRTPWPGAAQGESVSFEIHHPPGDPPRLMVGRQPVPLYRTRPRGDRLVYFTPRLAGPGTEGMVRLRTPARPQTVSAWVHRWRPVTR